jgi:2-polyprenyl-3-methyl-5-hydroxy-6-metoxy-1,4-benzoquinol methylase
VTPTPEFRYDVDVDVDADTSHAIAIRLAGWNKRVLDVGCATGYVAAALADRGCDVVGIEGDERAAERARDVCERVVVGDLEDPATIDGLGDDTFDVVLCGDVLEHLVDPVPVLRRAVEHLRPDGLVIVSLPNIAHVDVRLALLQGHFPYADLGLLDRTHLRFFTATSAHELLEQGGLTVVRTERLQRNTFTTELAPAIDRSAVDPQVLQRVLADPNALTYQFVIVGVRHGAASLVEDLARRCTDLEAEATLQRNQRMMAEHQLARSLRHRLARRFRR